MQTAELIAYLTDNLLPTTAAIINVIEEWWDIRYTVPGLNKWLHKHGFSYRKPVGVPHKFSAEAQQAFVAAYEQLKQDAEMMPPSCLSTVFIPLRGRSWPTADASR